MCCELAWVGRGREAFGWCVDGRPWVHALLSSVPQSPACGLDHCHRRFAHLASPHASPVWPACPAAPPSCRWVEAAGGRVVCADGVEVSPLVSYAGEGLEDLAAGKDFNALYDVHLQAGAASFHRGLLQGGGGGGVQQRGCCTPGKALCSIGGLPVACVAHQLLVPPSLSLAHHCRGSLPWPLKPPSRASRAPLPAALRSTPLRAPRPRAPPVAPASSPTAPPPCTTSRRLLMRQYGVHMNTHPS